MINFNLDFNESTPIYLQIENEVIKEIAKGDLKNKLPSIRKISNQLDINVHTVHKAYTDLKIEGYITVNKRNGFVIKNDFQNEEFIYKMYKDLDIYIAKCKVRNIDKNIVYAYIDKIIDKYYTNTLQGKI